MVAHHKTRLQNHKCKNSQQREYWVFAGGAEQVCRVLCWESSVWRLLLSKRNMPKEFNKHRWASFFYKGGHSFWPYKPCAQIFLWLRAMRHTPQRPERKGTSRRVSEAGNTNCSPGPRCHSRARVVCSDRSAHFPSAPPQWQFQPPCLWLPGLCPTRQWNSHRPDWAIALLHPGWTTVGEPHSRCLQALSHCYSTGTKTESKLDKRKSVIALLTLAVISGSLCQFVPSIYFLLCVD